MPSAPMDAGAQRYWGARLGAPLRSTYFWIMAVAKITSRPVRSAAGQRGDGGGDPADAAAADNLTTLGPPRSGHHAQLTTQGELPGA